MYRLADRLDEAAAALTAARPEEHEPVGAFDDRPGAPGELTAALQRQLGATLHARGREATAAAARLGDLAVQVRQAAAGYSAADDSARERAARVGEPRGES